MKTTFRDLAPFLFGLLLPIPAHAGPVYEPIAAFERGPVNPSLGSLLQHTDGNFYGTSPSGGASGFGTIYKVTPAGEVSVLVHFTGTTGPAKGRNPVAGLISNNGSLWGTTFIGGTANLGTVFKADPNTGGLTTVVEFTGTAGPTKGSQPYARLAEDPQGNLWGTTYSGGSDDLGTVFKVITGTGECQTIVEFTGTSGPAKGSNPYAGLLSDGSGFFWGTTGNGGASDLGTVFKLNAGTRVLTTQVEFTGSSGPAKGRTPYSRLVSDGLGFLWGTTRYGGGDDFGTVFKINGTTGGLTTLVEFTGTSGAAKGRFPYAGLTTDGAGFIWGTTREGGAGDLGTVFKLQTGTGALTTLVDFTGSSGAVRGAYPQAGLISDGAGFLWGTTSSGGAGSLGAVFKINTSTGAQSTVADFFGTIGSGKGKNPYSGLVNDGNGFFWGTTRYGGAGDFGTIYKVHAASGALTTVVEFSGTAGAAKGKNPYASLVSDGSGLLWGTTTFGGTLDFGTVFKVNLSTGVLTTVAEFTGASGAAKGKNPYAGLVSDGLGFFWGTTYSGGAGNLGTVYKVHAGTGALTTLVEFTGDSGSFKGSNPQAALARDGTGWLWGTTTLGGALNFGTIYKVNAGTGSLTTVIEFTGTSGTARGSRPYAGLVNDGSGFFWGTTYLGGGAFDLGTVFKVHMNTSALTTLVEFTGTSGAAKGQYPQSGLVSDGFGNFWGTTYQGGAGNLGTIYKVSNGAAFTNVFDFTGIGGAVPGISPGYGTLCRHSDGHMVGTTYSGGVTPAGNAAGYGQIFRLHFGPTVVTLPATATATTATLRGTVNANGNLTTVSFEYGTDPALAGATVVAAGTTTSAGSPENFTSQLTTLTSGTVYYYRVRGVNAENPVIQTGEILSFIASGGTPTAFSIWAASYGLSGAAAAPSADPDKDGIENRVEYIISGNPTVPSTSGQPTSTVGEGTIVFTFSRADASETPDVTVAVETGTDLLTWPTVYNIGATAAASSPGVFVIENGAAPDTITVSIPQGTSRVKFARLRVTVTP